VVVVVVVVVGTNGGGGVLEKGGRSMWNKPFWVIAEVVIYQK